jgi:hypothetical protein
VKFLCFLVCRLFGHDVTWIARHGRPKRVCMRCGAEGGFGE